MHEYSLIRSLIEQLPDVLEAGELPRLRKITLASGPLSGVEPLLALEAFEQLKIEAGLPDCQLVIQDEPLAARCDACHSTFEIENFRFICPDCGHTQVTVISGESVRIQSVTVAQDTPA